MICLILVVIMCHMSFNDQQTSTVLLIRSSTTARRACGARRKSDRNGAQDSRIYSACSMTSMSGAPHESTIKIPTGTAATAIVLHSTHDSFSIAKRRFSEDSAFERVCGNFLHKEQSRWHWVAVRKKGRSRIDRGWRALGCRQKRGSEFDFRERRETTTGLEGLGPPNPAAWLFNGWRPGPSPAAWRGLDAS